MTVLASRLAFSSEDQQRVDLVSRLAASGDMGDIEDLLSMLGDPSWTVRRAVVAALAANGPLTVGPLGRVLGQRRDNETFIAATVDALSAVTGDADSMLAAMVADAEIPVLADIAQILGRRRTVSALPTLIFLSRHRDDNVAVSAIEALGRIGGRAAVDSLVDAVQSGNFFRAFPAIDVLGRSGDPRAAAPLTALLEQPQYVAEAARALGRTGDVAAVAPLMRLVARSSSAGVRLAAVALTELHHRHNERFGVGDGVQADIARAGREPTGVVRQLLRALAEADPSEQAAICFLLGVLRDPSTASALTALLDASAPVAEAAGVALRRLGRSAEEQIVQGLRSGTSRHKRALLPLISDASGRADVVACLGDDDPDVRVLACEALARVGLVAAVGDLFPLLGDRDARVSYAAVAALQSLGSLDTERMAIEAAASADLHVRRAALRILAYFGSSPAIETFLSALLDADERVRESAIQGLPFMEDPRAFEALLVAAKDPVEKTRAAAMRSLGQCADDMRARAYLIKGLGDADPWVRYYACQSLGKLAFEPAVEAIVKLLDDPAGQVRVAAIEALSCLDSELAIGALQAATTDADSDIQRAAIVGLGVAKHAAALPLILRSLRSEDSATRLVAVSALAGFEAPEALAGLETAASDVEESVRTAAIGFLAAMPGKAATRALIGLLPGASSLEPVLGALALPVEGRVAGLLSALEEADDETAPALTSALARLRLADAVTALTRAMTLPNVAARKAAASALAVLASKEGLAMLRKAATDDPEPQVRQICALLLSR
jgi:HEAT repeat protein